MGWRLGLVVYAIFLGAFNNLAEAIISQIVATIAVGGFGFYVAQFRTISLEARINEIRNLQHEDDAAKKKMVAGVRVTMRLMVGAIIAVDVMGAVYIGITAAMADGLVGHAIAGSLLLALLSIIPFCAGGFIQAVAKLIPQEERQRLMERIFYQNVETMDNAVYRYGKKARKLPPEQVLAEGWAGLEAAASALDAQEGHQGLFSDAVAQMRALQQPIATRERLEAQGQMPAEPLVPQRTIHPVKGKDYDASGELVAVHVPQLGSPSEWFGPESESVPAAPFGNGASQPSVPASILTRLIESSGLEPALLLHLLESGQLESLLLRFVPGTPSGRKPTAEPVQDMPLKRLNALLSSPLVSREQLLTLVQQHEQLATVLAQEALLIE